MHETTCRGAVVWYGQDSGCGRRSSQLRWGRQQEHKRVGAQDAENQSIGRSLVYISCTLNPEKYDRKQY